MANAAVEIDVSRAVKKLQRVSKVYDPVKLLRLIGQTQLGWVNKNFKDAGTEKKWRPLSPNTIASRRKGSSRPLQNTGRLRQSFEFSLRGRTTVAVGTESQIAPFHHFGTRPYEIRGNPLRFNTASGIVFAKIVHHPGLPARPLLPTKAVAERIALRAVHALIDRATRGQG